MRVLQRAGDAEQDRNVSAVLIINESVRAASKSILPRREFPGCAAEGLRLISVAAQEEETISHQDVNLITLCACSWAHHPGVRLQCASLS